MPPTQDARQRYVAEQLVSNEEFWRRFGGEPDVLGLAALDLGCGQGVMSVRLARAGAARVLGVDLNPKAIASAECHLARSHPELALTVSYVAADIAALAEDGSFDLVVSKDTFEHVADLDTLLCDIHRLLRPGGRVYAGFSPLYHSPFGDHGRACLKIPWAHTLLPLPVVVAWARRCRREPFRCLADLGLNGLTPAQFRAAFERSPLETESIRYNRGDKALLRVLSWARSWRLFERYATVSMYVVLRRLC
ncbi:class I SAM-dependent methyltransferase [Pseudonocardia sp.]|uniref:class I SAM-dependent methyltransferase n=1 Tax=Pseudonocardia sp. TaxID=60912 RepID=UPI003D129783